jgi:REP element-mobilizing transposase RayT
VFPWDEQKPTVFGDVLNSLGEEPEVEEMQPEVTPIAAATDDALLSLADLINQKNEVKPSTFLKFESAEESDELLEPLPEMITKPELNKDTVQSDSPIDTEDKEDPLDKAALEPTQVIRRDFKESRTIPADLPPINPLEDTAPRSTYGASKPILEPHSPGVSSLNYTSVLLPRFPTQFLAGELAEWLGEWLPQLCVAYGWRIERISIRPHYIQLTVQVPPTVSPGYMVRILREETSRRILKNQPELLVNNPANDFWAPGYLVMSGFLPPTQQMLEEYIQQTRRRQGLEPQDN